MSDGMGDDASRHSGVTNGDIYVRLERIMGIINLLTQKLDSVANAAEQARVPFGDLTARVSSLERGQEHISLQLAPILERAASADKQQQEMGVALRGAVFATIGILAATILAAVVLHYLGYR